MASCGDGGGAGLRHSVSLLRIWLLRITGGAGGMSNVAGGGGGWCCWFCLRSTDRRSPSRILKAPSESRRSSSRASVVACREMKLCFGSNKIGGTWKRPTLGAAESLSMVPSLCSKSPHTFSAFWLRSSVVSVLISLISDTEYTVLLEIILIFTNGLVTCCACTTALARIASV
eukprot:COSAG01_NODE_1206_length_11242_cov_29.405905_14_plen_173_part_00